MKQIVKIVLVVGILAAVVIAVTALAFSGKAVEIVQVSKGCIVCEVAEDGYVQSATSRNIHSTQIARVVQVPVETGQHVKKGQTLAVLENLDLSVQISEVRSQLAQAETAAGGARAALEKSRLALQDARDNMARVQELFKEEAVSKVECDKAQLQVETAEQSVYEQSSRLQSIEAQAAGLSQSLSELTAKERQLVVKSPVDGTVLELPVKPEQVMLPGALVASVAAPNQLEVKADILSDDLADVKVGEKVNITAPFLDKRVLVGEVKQIYPRAEEKQSALGIIQRRVPVIVSLPDPADLKPGYQIRVAIQTLRKENVLLLPREAVCTTGDGSKEVMVVTNNRIRHRTVTTGLSDQDRIEITSGLKAGDLVVRDGSLNIKEKSKVRPINK
ncbi:MAG: efflux RND transporter periplasmic adaptor subunit [Ammonifex sp.]|nr:MAG: efflux RND transporter periplasmic adaptor subunit [Ammonifex sp.]